MYQRMYVSETSRELKSENVRKSNNYKIEAILVQINRCKWHPCFIPTCFSHAGSVSRNRTVCVYLDDFLIRIAVKVHRDNEPVSV